MENNENRYILLKYLLRLTLENGRGIQREKKLSGINLSINLKLEVGIQLFFFFLPKRLSPE